MKSEKNDYQKKTTVYVSIKTIFFLRVLVNEALKKWKEGGGLNPTLMSPDVK